MTLEERVQKLEDIEAIRYLQAKYQRLLDSRDFNGIAGCFADDVVSSYGNGEHTFEGKNMVVGFLMKSMAIDMPSAHMIHGGEIDIIDGANAKAKWYLQDFLVYPKYSINIAGAAIYDVAYVKVNGAWLIKSIGYKRVFEYKDSISQTQGATFGKTTILDELKATPADQLVGYNKAFIEMSNAPENK